MSEFWDALKRLDLRAILLTPTTNGFLQFVRYLFVGGIATVADWGALFLLTRAGLHYSVSAAIAFVLGLAVNFLLSKRFVFRASEARVRPVAEFLSYAAIGLVGLGLTEGIMWLFTERIGLHYMLSKAIATALVLVWNYAARKIAIYK